MRFFLGIFLIQNLRYRILLVVPYGDCNFSVRLLILRCLLHRLTATAGQAANRQSCCHDPCPYSVPDSFLIFILHILHSFDMYSPAACFDILFL